MPDTAAGRETLIQDSKDLGRSIDYLETRTDIDRNRIAYMGVSMGAALGVNLTAVEDRFKAVIFLDGGFFNEKPLPGTDQADFAPRIKAPALLISRQVRLDLSGQRRADANALARRPPIRRRSRSTLRTMFRSSAPTLCGRCSLGWTSIWARSGEIRDSSLYSELSRFRARREHFCRIPGQSPLRRSGTVTITPKF